MSQNDPEELAQMVADVAAAPPLFQPSRFWAELGGEHLELVRGGGFDHFKRTIAPRYFSWRTLGILAHQLTAVVAAWRAAADAAVLRARLPRASVAGIGHRYNPLAAFIYRTYVAMLFDVVQRQDRLGLLQRLEEPLVGDPFLVLHRDRRTSQDLCNSVHELYSIFIDEAERYAEGDIPGPDVAELGAGYGRLAYVVLSAFPRATYTIIDIPPALYLSQRYLTTVLPDVSVFRFRPFESFADVHEEFWRARLRFLTPRELALLPDRSFDHIATISTLHEMTRPQVANYLAMFDRLARRRVYTKQWRVARVRHEKTPLREYDYPIPTRWRRIFHHRHPIQRWFFHALYDTAAGQPSGGSR